MKVYANDILHYVTTMSGIFYTYLAAFRRFSGYFQRSVESMYQEEAF